MLFQQNRARFMGSQLIEPINWTVTSRQTQNLGLGGHWASGDGCLRILGSITCGYSLLMVWNPEKSEHSRLVRWRVTSVPTPSIHTHRLSSIPCLHCGQIRLRGSWTESHSGSHEQGQGILYGNGC